MGRRQLIVSITGAALFGLAAVAGIAATSDGGGAPAAAAFRLEDGSAGCNYRESGEIACRAAGTAVAAVLSPDGKAGLESSSAVAWDDSTPVLLASESWWNGAVSCRVSGADVVCSNGAGAISAGARSAGGVG
jgi:hypothetical protein